MHYASLLLYAFSIISCMHGIPSAITYQLNGGRFGDNISTYSKAKWYSYTFKIPLLYKPFEYSDQLVLATLDKAFISTEGYAKIVYVKNETDIRAHLQEESVLFISTFYSQTPGLYEEKWKDATWKKLIEYALTPLEKYFSLEVEKNTKSVGLHIRKGGGFDKPLAKNVDAPNQKWPTKFPDDEYYIAQLQQLRILMGKETPLLAYLLTDDPDPASLAALYQEKCADPLLKFRYRTEGNHHSKNIIEDFLVLSQCDYLIRSSSLFAKAAQLAGNHTIIIYPLYGYWSDDEHKVIINPVGITINH